MGEISATASILGMILGTAGFVMSILVYLRDRAQVKITLKWDMTEVQPPNRQYGLVKLTNTGRRPIYISIVALELPKTSALSHFILNESIEGTKLLEGDKPLGYFVWDYDSLKPYANAWAKIRAYAEDSTGRTYYSEYPSADSKAPKWSL